MEIARKDLDRLYDAVQYVIQRAGKEIDSGMVEYLKEELEAITEHIVNENYGTQEAVEIDVLLGVLLPEGEDGP